MKRMLLAAVLCTSVAAAQVPKTLTLADAIALGMAANKTLKISGAKEDAARGRAGEAGTALLPSLRFEGSYRRLSEIDPFQISLPILPAPIVVFPSIPNTYTMRATLQQPLFTGFKLLNNARAASRLADAAAEDEANDEAEVVVTVTSAYWMEYQTIENRKAVGENVARLEAYERDTKNLMQAGLATRNDLLKVEVQLSNARLTLLDASNDVQIALMNLNIAIGEPLENDIVPVSIPGGEDSASAADPGKEMASLTGAAGRNRPDLAAMKLRVDAAEASLHAAQGGWWPQIYLSGSYYYSRPNSRIVPARDEFTGTWDVGVTLQFDVWNWGLTGYQTDQARASLIQNQWLYEQMKENASLEVRKNALTESRAREKVGVARLGVEQADENVRSTDEKYAKGAASSTDVLDASVALLQARTNLTGALVDLELAYTRLLKSLGVRSGNLRGSSGETRHE